MRPTLFEYAGRDTGLLRLARAHHERCLADPELSHPFSHSDQHPEHVERLATYWAEVFGGPPTYTASCGNQTDLLVMHSGNGDMTGLSRRFVDCFVAAADDADLPDDADFRDALRAYMEWAVQQFNAYPEQDAHVQPGLAVPHWSWDGLQSP
jgi:hemoglobin